MLMCRIALRVESETPCVGCIIMFELNTCIVSSGVQIFVLSSNAFTKLGSKRRENQELSFIANRLKTSNQTADARRESCLHRRKLK